MTDNRNTILAVILSGLVLIGWQYFFNIPQMEKQRAAQQAQSEMVKPAPQAAPGATTPQTGAAPSASAPAGYQQDSRAPPPPAAKPRLPPGHASRSTPRAFPAAFRGRARGSTIWRWCSSARPSI